MRRVLLVLLAGAGLVAGVAPAAEGGKKRKPPPPKGTYTWTVEATTTYYRRQECTAWGRTRVVTENRVWDEQESGRGKFGTRGNHATGFKTYKGTEKFKVTVITTHPDGNQIVDREEDDTRVFPTERSERSGLIRRRDEGTLEFLPVAGTEGRSETDLRLPDIEFKPPKKNASVTVPFSVKRDNLGEPEENCKLEGRAEFSGTLTIKRIR